MIDIGEGAVAAALAVPGHDGPEDFAAEAITRGGGLDAALRGVVASVAGRRGVDAIPGDVEDVYVAIHPGYLHLRVVEVPFRERRKVREVLAFELAGTLSVDVADLVLDSVPLGPSGAAGGEGGRGGAAARRTLAVAIEKSFLGDLLDVLGSLGLDPVWVGPALFMAPSFEAALSRAAALSQAAALSGDGTHGGVRAFVTEDFISVTSDGSPILFNYFKGAEGLALSLAYLGSEGAPIQKVRSLGFDRASLAGLLPGVEVEEVRLPGGLPPGAAGIAVLWHGVTTGAVKDAINLRSGEFAYTREARKARRKLALTAALAVGLLVIVSGDLSVRYRALAGDIASYDRAMEAAYRGLFPGETVRGDALYALEAKARELEGEAGAVMGGISPLEVMKAIAVVSDMAPDLGVRLTELSMAGGKVNAKGSASSFEAANRFRELLAGQGPFSGVALSDVKKRPAGGAAFSLTIEVG